MFPLLFLLFFSCQNTTNENKVSDVKTKEVVSDTVYTWTKLLDSAAWKKNYNFQMFSINDTLWTFHPDRIWYSKNGKNWTKSVLENSINNLAFLDYVYFKGSVYGLGYFSGNIEQFTFKPEIVKTTDFKSWTTISRTSNLPNRFFIIHLFLKIKFGLLVERIKTQNTPTFGIQKMVLHGLNKKKIFPLVKEVEVKLLHLTITCFCLIMMFGVQ